MDKIQKFLLSLSKEERTIFYGILEDVRGLKLTDYDIKSLKGMKGLFRLRKGKIRIVFAKRGNIGVALNMGYRKDVYK